MSKRKHPSDDEDKDYEHSEDDQPKTKTKASQASKATEQPLTIKKPKIGSSDCQSPSGSKKKSTHDNDVEVFSSSEGEKYVKLGQKKRVTVREFKGEPQQCKILVDIREFYGKDKEDEKPGKKGICLNADQWACLKKSINIIDSFFDNSQK
ncbi:transcriptional Coactivator p15-domain-containing protein [Suillus bovinus]|uniref:transcriptional Coactivator p15-domain-containing protein n=1 Tax=Suillus bovinus TaxID=48563 RepID=UPI001B8690BB|nr:transcriptional Coactivator p15-domain-containing protein [Suillus bovinus]KAG2145994.1 transcriptional Coactivator p15-domain-containing protein [Suillus bovinus]